MLKKHNSVVKHAIILKMNKLPTLKKNNLVYVCLCSIVVLLTVALIIIRFTAKWEVDKISLIISLVLGFIVRMNYIIVYFIFFIFIIKFIEDLHPFINNSRKHQIVKVIGFTLFSCYLLITFILLGASQVNFASIYTCIFFITCFVYFLFLIIYSYKANAKYSIVRANNLYTFIIGLIFYILLSISSITLSFLYLTVSIKISSIEYITFAFTFHAVWIMISGLWNPNFNYKLSRILTIVYTAICLVIVSILIYFICTDKNIADSNYLFFYDHLIIIIPCSLFFIVTAIFTTLLFCFCFNSEDKINNQWVYSKK
jgi:hypothetical protein